MRAVRLIIAMLIAISVAVAPAGAALASLAPPVALATDAMPDCGEKAAAPDCKCCDAQAACPPAACALKCFKLVGLAQPLLKLRDTTFPANLMPDVRPAAEWHEQPLSPPPRS